jgi:hypothetical protein
VPQQPFERIFSIPGARGTPAFTVVWDQNVHINMAFSEDGAYLYYNRHETDGSVAVYRRQVLDK